MLKLLLRRCETCTAYKNLSAEDKIKNQSSQNHHLEMKSEARRLMANDKKVAEKDSTICCANYDMQKILTTPKADISVMYYLCKLNVWNFTIYKTGVFEGFCFLWNEKVGHRGSNEVAYYVWSFIYQQANL